MSESLRSILAVAAGFLYITVLALAMDFVLRAAAPHAFGEAGRVESAGVLLATLAYVGVFAISGCYLAARLAPSRPLLHALVLGGVGLAFTSAATIVYWQTAPIWYHLISLVLVLPYAWAGGRLREIQLERGGGTATGSAAGAAMAL